VSTSPDLLRELLWVRLRLKRSRGLRLLRELLGGGPAAAESDDVIGQQEAVATEVGRLGKEADEHRTAARVQGDDPGDNSLGVLTTRLGLTPGERDIVAALLAPELDEALAREWRAMSDDVVRRRPTLGALLELLGDDLPERDALRDLLEPDARLRARHIVLVEADAPEATIETPFLQRQVKLSERVVAHLRGRDRVDEDIAIACAPAPCEGELGELILPAATADAVQRLASERASAPGSALRLHVRGPRGSGRKLLASALVLAEPGGAPAPKTLLVVDWCALLAEPATYVERLRKVTLEALLTGACLYLQAFDELPPIALGAMHASQLASVLEGLRVPVVLATQVALPQLDGRLSGLAALELPFPEPEERARLWERALKGRAVSRQVKADELGHKYVLTGGAILRTVVGAQARASARPGKRPAITLTDLDIEGRVQSTRGLLHLADRMEKWFTFDDAVLAPETREGLDSMLAFARHRRMVLDDWGFRRLLPYGQGLSALFTGPPGTGKTMVATIMARELSMEIYRVDLSRIVNKYIGETEKNLSRIFDDARGSNCILLFDEADALFARRTEVKSSVDRYANLEVNYLLQRMEQHDGVTILTTNFEASLDKAFRRRLKFHVSFPMPAARERTQLWKAVIPAEAKTTPKIRFHLLGKEFEFSGGDIKNAVLRAAIYAAELGEPISEDLLFEAAEAEARESGKLVVESDDRTAAER